MATDEGKVPEGGQEPPKEPVEPKGAKAKQKPPKKGGGVPGWAVAVIVIVVIAVIAGIAVGVVMAMSGGGENQAPTITSLTANPSSVTTGHSSTITCVASDPDGDTLDYDWEYTGGELQGSGTTRTWIAPNVEGTFTVTVTVDDGNGGTDQDSVAIVVANAPTPTPTPTSTASPTPTATSTVAPTPSQGSIDIQSTPSGAAVYIDGVDTGSITPYVATHLNEGPHVVRLVYPHYEWRTESVPVFGGATEYVNWALDWSPTQSVTIQPDALTGKDAYVFEGDPSSNRGTNAEIFVSGNALGSQCRAYIQFLLGSVPSSAVIIDAKLGLFYEDNAGGSTEGPVGVYRVTGTWDETTITWDNQPAIVAGVVATTTVPAIHTDDWIYWDIDDLVQGWISGSLPNRGLTLRDTDETTFEGYKGFYSDDNGADTPKLTIQYYDPAP
ncbi:MAG: DNRLRE domain-containing protein [Dehalococcoidia bacterium]